MNAAYRGGLQTVKWLCEMKAEVECKSKVRVICVFEVLYVAYVKSRCTCVVYMCYEWFDAHP